MKKIAQCTKCCLPDFPVRFRAQNQIVTGTKDDVYDELTMSTLLFSFNDELAAWVSIDIGNMIPAVRDIIYQKVKEAFPELKKTKFMVNGTHTHEGPEFYQDPVMMGNKLNHIITEADLDMDFVSFLAERTKAMLVECRNKLRPFYAEIGVVSIEGCYSNRNGLEEPADKDISLIRFLDEETDGLLALWMNMSTHSTLLHPRNLKMSGDLVGQVCEKLGKEFGCRPLPTVGCAGDSSTRLVRHRSDDFADDLKELERISTSIVTQIMEKVVFYPIDIYKMETKEVELVYRYYIDPQKTQFKIDALKKQADMETNPDRKRLFMSSRRVLLARVGVHEISEDLIGTAIDMGELKWGAFPGELVGSLGLKVIRHKPHDHRLVACYINDKHGYLVEKEKYDSRGFESIAAIIPAGLNEVLTDMIIKELDGFDEKVV